MSETPMTEASLRDELEAKMSAVTVETLPAFIADALNRQHEYGTICVALGAIAAAAAKAADRSPQGGITGFQAGAVFWEFMRQWGVFGEGPKRIVNYADMLYPQYDHKFAKRISADTWMYLRDEATKHLANANGAHPEVVAHWQSIVAGTIPFGYTVTDDD